jgi:hypothetical protein
VQRLCPSREQRIRQLLTLEEMGDRKPSQFPRHLRGLAPDVTEEFLYTIWSSRLPPTYRPFSPVSSSAAWTPQPAVRTASPRWHPSRRSLALVHPPTPPHFCRRSTNSLARWRHLAPSRTVSAPASGTLPSAPGTPDPAPRIQTPAPGIADQTADPPPEATPHQPAAGTIAASGQECRSVRHPAPITSRELTQQKPPAVHVCPTTGRVFIKDRSSKRQILADTGSDLCVYPRRLVPRREGRANYDLCAANGTNIYTYGWLPLSLNLGLRRSFTWRFVVADITHPIIGVDFLSHFGLLVDCRNNRLLNGITSLSVPAQAASALVPSVKTDTGGTPIDSILADFPDLTRTAGAQREVHHNTVHHIRTIPGSLVTCRPRRLAPDRLAIATPHLSQEGQWVESLRRLQSPQLPCHNRTLPRPAYP